MRRLSLTLESRVESADVAESHVTAFCCRAGYGQLQCEEVGLAVRESVANAVLHGNRCDMSKKVGLTAELTEAELTISIRDEGEGFDPDALPDPLVPDNLLNETGRGFFLVRTCMDDVVVRRTGSHGLEVTMTKYLSKTPRRRTVK